MNLRMTVLKFGLIALALTTSALAQSAKDPTSKLQSFVDNYLAQYGEDEHISSVSLSVYSPETKNINVTKGTTEFDGGSSIEPSNLFQIGSITKSFISAILLQLEADPKNHFSINDPLKNYLPQYPKWGDVTIKQLLNMTSNIPSYSESYDFGDDLAANPMRQWTPEELVNYVYDKPMLHGGFHYSNTNYILAGMVISKITGHTIEEEMKQRFFAQNNSTHLKLKNTAYITHLYPSDLSSRVVHGYLSVPGSVFPYNTDVKNYSLSWAGAAGANIATTEDVVHWAQALFSVTDFLPEKQLNELTTLVSEETGEEIGNARHLTPDDPTGYGLGIAASYNFASPRDIMYYYEGGTLGYRAFYIYVPSKNIVVAAAVNSSVFDDHLAELVSQAYYFLANQSSGKKLQFKKLPDFKIKK